FPAMAAIVTAPQPAIVAGEDGVGVFGVDPNVVEIAVRGVGDRAEAAPSVGVGEEEGAAGLEDFVFVLGIDNQVGEVKGTPHLELAGIEGGPGFSAIVGAEQCALFALDGGVDGLRLAGRHGEGDAAVGFLGESFGVGGGEFGPMLAAVGGLEQPAAGAAGAKGPALPAEVPKRRIEGLGGTRIHGEHGAPGGSVGAGQDFAPRLAAVAGFVDAALVVIVPEMSGGAGEDGVAGGGV